MIEEKIHRPTRYYCARLWFTRGACSDALDATVKNINKIRGVKYGWYWYGSSPADRRLSLVVEWITPDELEKLRDFVHHNQTVDEIRIWRTSTYPAADNRTEVRA